jgi:hypothetical protein
MKRTPESLHSFLRAAKGLTLASYNATMASTTSKTSEKSDKLQNEHHEDTSFSRNDALNNTPAAHHEEQIVQEKAANREGGMLGMFQKLGDLPEWNVPGYGQLRGKALNNSIAWASCLAFL